MTQNNFTRREVLAAFLGVPAALAACRSRNAPPLPPGEIVGASDVIGHRVRDGLSITPSNDQWRRTSVVIVGGGVAGLSAAWRLLKAGFDDFVLLELESAPGGTARSGASPVIAYPWGAHYLPAPMKENIGLVSLLAEMGTLEGSPLLENSFSVAILKNVCSIVADGMKGCTCTLVQPLKTSRSSTRSMSR